LEYHLVHQLMILIVYNVQKSLLVVENVLIKKLLYLINFMILLMINIKNMQDYHSNVRIVEIIIMIVKLVDVFLKLIVQHLVIDLMK